MSESGIVEGVSQSLLAKPGDEESKEGFDTYSTADYLQ